MRLTRALALAVSLCWMSAANPLQAADNAPTVERFTLANGLEVVVVPNHRVPAVSHMVWYRVGAADDPQGKSGLAHYHEHAMFLGTQRYSAGQFESIVARNGGQQNAFTGSDTTSYYINIHKSQLPLAMELEADRMRGIAPSDAAMEKEKQVIIEERRERIENNPYALFDEQLGAALYRNHPYRIPVIGWMHEMHGLSKQDVLAFHRRWYHPNNAVLVISGDITAKELRPLVEKYYGGLTRAKLPERRWTDEPPQNNARRLTLEHRNVKQPQWKRIYMAPSLAYGKKEQALPLLVFSQLLGGNKSSLLYQSIVVEQKLASAIDVSYNGFAMGPGELAISATPEKDVSLATLEAAIDKELVKWRAELPEASHITRAKTRLKADAMYARDGLTGMARIMGWMVMIGLPVDYFSRWPELIEAVTTEQMLTAAQNVLKPEQSVTGMLIPATSAPNEAKEKETKQEGKGA